MDTLEKILRYHLIVMPFPKDGYWLAGITLAAQTRVSSDNSSGPNGPSSRVEAALQCVITDSDLHATVNWCVTKVEDCDYIWSERHNAYIHREDNGWYAWLRMPVSDDCDDNDGCDDYENYEHMTLREIGSYAKIVQCPCDVYVAPHWSEE